MTCVREGTVQLPDGRRLGYGEYGRRGGAPVLFFHGMPGGRAFDLGRAVADQDLWLFVLERPGIGLSDRRPGASVLDWPGDVAAFADALGFDHFAVAGASAGAPYALACGHRLTSRVTLVVLLAAWITFVDEPGLDVLLPEDFRGESPTAPTLSGNRGSDVLGQKHAAMRGRGHPDGFHREFFGEAADTLPRYWMRMLEATYGGVPPGPADFIHEYAPWGFAAGEVPVPVRAWHGDADEAAPLPLVEELIRRLPDASLTVCAGEGHFLHPRHRAEYLAVLARAR